MLRNPQSKTLFRVGLIAFVLWALLQIPGRMHLDLHPDLWDGMRGVCLGVFIGTMAVTTWRNGRPATR